jgi:hypothetical protein
MSLAASSKSLSHRWSALLEGVSRRAAAAGVFGPVEIEGARLSAAAKAPAAPAWYRLCVENGELWVSLVTPDRWLSHSVEADLLNTGDHLDELIHEELVELGETGPALPCEHFRDEDKLFTFRTRVPLPPGDAPAHADIETATRFLLAYEACFRRLGDIDAGE